MRKESLYWPLGVLRSLRSIGEVPLTPFKKGLAQRTNITPPSTPSRVLLCDTVFYDVRCSNAPGLLSFHIYTAFQV